MFLQPSGPLGGWDLWLGAGSDTGYFKRSGILEYQEEFRKNDNQSTLSFTNILDKGYGSFRGAAWLAGGKLYSSPSLP